MKTTRKLLSLLLAVLCLAPLTSCNDKETDMGIALVDTTTLYEGIYDTLYADAAWSEQEDSLLTTNYSFGIIGNFTDPVFGKVSSTLYTQIALPSNATDIALGDELVIDSVLLTLTKYQVFPDTGRTYNFHFEVKQLAEAIKSDSQYYSHDALPVDNSKVFFDDDVEVRYIDTLVVLKMRSSIFDVLHRTATAEEFVEQTKGLRVRLTSAGEEGMLSIDFSAATTCLRAYYHYTYESDTTYGYYTFLMGAGTTHFTHFDHNYSGTLFASGNPVAGNLRLYLEPLGGQQTRLRFNSAIQAFHAAHPYAVIHHAELIMPVAPESPSEVPDQILVLGHNDVNGEDEYIDDLIDVYTLRGYDGTYHEDGSYYRMRITQHLQGLLRKGSDPGMLLLLNSRRHAAQRLIMNGTSLTNRPRIAVVFSE